MHGFAENGHDFGYIVGRRRGVGVVFMTVVAACDTEEITFKLPLNKSHTHM